MLTDRRIFIAEPESTLRARATALLETYWSIPERQMETSVVLAKPPLVTDSSSSE